MPNDRSQGVDPMDPEEDVEIGRLAGAPAHHTHTSHQFETQKARGAGRTDEDANAGEKGEADEEGNQTRGESRRAPGPGKATPK